MRPEDGPERATIVVPAEPQLTGRRRPGARPGRLVPLLIVLLVVGQRLGVEIGESELSLAVPVTYAVAAVLLWRGQLRVNRLRAELYLLGVIGILAATALVGMSGALFSPTSVVLLLAIYLPWVLRVPDAGAERLTHAARTFVRVMVVIAAVGAAQLAAQLLGVWEYEDYLTAVLGENLVLQDFNTHNPLFYASPVYKANAFVMLEPSFLSQYCALAVLIGVILRVPAWQLLVLVAGVGASVSGTGILLLFVGAMLIAVRTPRSIRPSYAAAAGVALILVLLSPVAALLVDRSDETTRPGTSGYQRFVQPYEETIEGLDAERQRYLIGAGAGSSERLLASDRAGQVGQPVVYTIVPKLFFEYGAIAGSLFALFIVLAMIDRVPWRAIPGSLIFMTFVLSGGLLQPHTAYLAWLLTGFWARDEPLPRQWEPRTTQTRGTTSYGPLVPRVGGQDA